jgi:hypothetical protein
MHVLVKLVCDRCFAMYRSELDAEGWTSELPEPPPLEGICSVCGRVEGHRTVQLRSSQLNAPAAAPEEDKGPREP